MLVAVNAFASYWDWFTVDRHPKDALLPILGTALPLHALLLWDELRGRHASESPSAFGAFLGELSALIFLVYPLLLLVAFFQALTEADAYVVISTVLGFVAWLLLVGQLQGWFSANPRGRFGRDTMRDG